MIRRLVGLGVVVLALGIHTFITDRETKPAEARGAKVMKLSGGDLRYRDQGDREDPVVVLLHGFACSLEWWDRVAPDLVRRGRRVIRFDLLGHGGSEKPRDGYEMANQASLVAEALAKLGVRRATIVGHSMGGTVASALVEAEPQLVRRVAVIGSSPRNGFADLPITGKVATAPVVGELVRRLAPDQVIKAGLDSAFADDTEVPDEFVDDIDGMTFSSFDKSSAEAHDFQEDTPNAVRIRNAAIPLLVIFGRDDEIVDPEAAIAWKETVPRSHVVQLDGVGHSPHWEVPREVVKEILAFTG